MSERGELKYWFDDECDNYRIHSLALKNWPLFRMKTNFQHIAIHDTQEFGRMLVLDGSPQSAVADEKIYHESLEHPAGVLLRNPPEDILILGGGEGATAREALRYRSVKTVLTVDIDEEVVNAARNYLDAMRKGVDEDLRNYIFIDDATEFLACTRQNFDLIVSDISDPEGENAAARCYTPDFFELARKRLRPHGIFVMQSQELSRVVWQGHKKHRELLKQFFKHVYSYRRFVPSFNYEQSFILASNAEIPDPGILQPQIVDYVIKERISGNLEEFSGDMFRHMFALSPDLKKKLEIN